MEFKKFKLKSDKYRSARGGYSRFLHIYCSKCKNQVFLYQKDGPGPLKRVYMDRIIAPEILSHYQYMKNIKDIPKLQCNNCKTIVGTPYIYKKELRKAFLLNPVSINKKIGRGIYPYQENIR